MSKKKKRKFYNSPNNSQPASGQANPANNSSPLTDSSGMPSVTNSSPSSYRVQPVVTVPPVSRFVADPQPPSTSGAHAEEYRVIKHDLIKVVILNALFLAGVLTLYYTNLNSHYLERWFGEILKF